MSYVQEYLLINVKWQWLSCTSTACLRSPDYEVNFQDNIAALEYEVNKKLAEGWTVQGAPFFDKNWGFRGSRAYQAIIRQREVQPAIVVDVPEIVMAQRVKALRSSLRLIDATQT